MSLPPLTHHEIMAIVEPFTRGGRSVDLKASDRQQRQLAFKPKAVPIEPKAAPIEPMAVPAEPKAVANNPAGVQVDAPALHDVLLLDCASPDWARLTRVLTRTDGLQARVVARGRDVAALLPLVEAVPAERCFSSGPGWEIARSYGVESGEAPLLSHGEVRVDGLQFTLDVPVTRNIAGEISLTPVHPGGLELPQDVLAVMGWNWARLVPHRQGWTSRLRLRCRGEKRTQRAEAALMQAALHLSRTLAATPQQYHARHLAARWGVFFRRGIPTLNALLLLFSLIMLSRFDWGGSPGLWMLLYHVPTVLVALSFCMQELPQFEIPPIPRRLTSPGWQPVPPASSPVVA
jgi:hypothetical protein